MVRYRIEIEDAHAHLFRVTLSLAHPAAEQLLSLPVWIPGSYMVREFARHLSGLQARQGRHERPLEQLDKTTWRVRCSGNAPLTLSWRVYAFDTSVRAAFLSAQRGFFNGTSVFLRAHGREDEPHQLTIAGLPKGWQVATALAAQNVKASGAGDYTAAGYDELVDHPVELGPFWRGHFKACGVPHEFVVAGHWPDFDGDRLLADTRRICEEQIRLWHGKGRPPFKRYVFMLNCVDDGYGGLEHRASTALIASRKDLPRRPAAEPAASAGAGLGPARAGATTDAAKPPPLTEGYVTLLGLISHEYFHTWNVKRLRPAEFTRYDYTRENHTQMLWFFEGFTSYYDDLVLRRCGLIDDSRYAQLLGKTVTQVLATPGRRVQSVAQASFDAWTKYYRPDENTANATVSYYTKGALVALALDLTLRQREGASLDGLMRRLWQLQRPITEADVLQAARDEAGRPLDAELHAWVHGTEDLPLADLLPTHGIGWQALPATAAQALGMKLGEAAGGLKVQAVMRGSAAEAAGFAAGDEWLALDGWRLRKPEDLNLLRRAGAKQAALVARDQRVLTLTLAPPPRGARPAQGAVNLSPQAEPAAEVRTRRERWFTPA